MSDNISVQINIRPKGHRLCLVHPQKQLVYVCLDCGENLICTTCVAKEHNGHKVREIEEIVQETYTGIQNTITEIEGVVIPKLQQHAADVEKQNDNTEKILQNCISKAREHENKLIQTIKYQASSVVKEFESIIQRNKKSSSGYNTESGEIMKILNDHIVECKDACKSNNDILLIDVFNDRKKLGHQWPPQPLIEGYTAKFVPGDNAIQHIVSAFGEMKNQGKNVELQRKKGPVTYTQEYIFGTNITKQQQNFTSVVADTPKSEAKPPNTKSHHPETINSATANKPVIAKKMPVPTFRTKNNTGPKNLITQAVEKYVKQTTLKSAILVSTIPALEREANSIEMGTDGKMVYCGLDEPFLIVIYPGYEYDFDRSSSRGKFNDNEKRYGIDIPIRDITFHPITNELYCISNRDDAVRKIEILPGKYSVVTSIVFETKLKGRCLAITKGGYFTIGVFEFNKVYVLTETGEIIQTLNIQTPIHITSCPKTGLVGVASMRDGAHILDANLKHLFKFGITIMNGRKVCRDVAFDNAGHVLVSCWTNDDINQVHVVSLTTGTSNLSISSKDLHDIRCLTFKPSAKAVVVVGDHNKLMSYKYLE